MNLANEKGNVIAYVLIAITTVAALVVGMFYMSTSSALGEIGVRNENRAYLLALTGKYYALMNNLPDNTASYPNGQDFLIDSANGDMFRLFIAGNNITSVGIVNIGTPFETQRQISITVAGFGSQADISSASGGMSFVKVESPPGFIQTSSSGPTTITLGKSDMTSTSAFGAVWYSGGGSIQNICNSGQCSFQSGFRAFFVFEFAAGSSGDGFTFTIFNADPSTNDIYSVGGGNGWGELMGYAGDSRSINAVNTGFADGDKRTLQGCCNTQLPLSPGCSSSLGCQGGRGIQPPKIAIEFDTHSNTGFGDICTGGTLDPDQRGDGLTNHMAYVFWGTNDQNLNCGSSAGTNTFDDNRHGAGTGGQEDPQNGRSELDPLGIDTTSYFNGTIYGSPSWLLNNSPTNVYAVRVEVTRSTLSDLVTGSYTVNTWIKQCVNNDPTCPAYPDGTNYTNTKISYTADPPTLSRTLTLSPAYHQKLSKFYFGWTAATGQATTESISINRFAMYLK